MKFLSAQRFTVQIKGDVMRSLDIKPCGGTVNNIGILFLRFQGRKQRGQELFPGENSQL